MQDLTQEEYALLSCSKEGWQKGQERYTLFIEILKRYIELWGTAISIDFNEMCFPEIIFDDALIANRGMQMRDCIFYGSVTFENIVFSDYVWINNCTYHSETIFQNLQFMKEIDWMGCTYKQKSLFLNIKF
ncbi:MAG: hypothetical protein JXQ76_06155, partial [Campylobacterales bacterium]|nr:hypothetical protein [Campylobacterales bacterium]